MEYDCDLPHWCLLVSFAPVGFQYCVVFSCLDVDAEENPECWAICQCQSFLTGMLTFRASSLGIPATTLIFEMIWGTYVWLHRQSKWSSSLWTLMSYLFSWRGFWEMIWRWRSVPFQENGSVAPRQGSRISNLQLKCPGSHGQDVEQHLSIEVQMFKRNVEL